MIKMKQNFLVATLAAGAILAPSFAFAAQLSSDGKAAIPHDVQQIIVVDYRAMQNSTAAMDLKDRVLPPELKRLETALKSSVRNNNIYPMGASGMSVVFLNQTTMVFGERDAVKAAVDARDGITPDFLS